MGLFQGWLPQYLIYSEKQPENPRDRVSGIILHRGSFSQSNRHPDIGRSCL